MPTTLPNVRGTLPQRILKAIRATSTEPAPVPEPEPEPPPPAPTGILLQPALSLRAKERFKLVVVPHEPPGNQSGELTKGVAGPAVGQRGEGREPPAHRAAPRRAVPGRQRHLRRYPFWMIEYLYTKGEPEDGTPLASFIDFLRSGTARAELADDGYTPCVGKDGQPFLLCRD